MCERERERGWQLSEREKEMEVFIGLAIILLAFRSFRVFFSHFYLFIFLKHVWQVTRGLTCQNKNKRVMNKLIHLG